jgi:hypothetical protein
MDGKPRTHFLPRLGREFYQGDAVIHWRLTVFDRATGWLDGSFHLDFANFSGTPPSVKDSSARPIV